MTALELTEEAVQSLPVPDIRYGSVVYWDTYLRGFGVRVHNSGRRVYVVRYRNSGAYVQRTVGIIDEYNIEDAREQAKLLIRLSSPRPAESDRPAPIPIRPGSYKRAQRYRIQCGYTKGKEGIHWFVGNRENAKFCCQSHYHLAHNHQFYGLSDSYSVVVKPPTPREKKSDFSQDLALLQSQLDSLENRLPELINQHVTQMLDTLFANLTTLLTTRLGEKP